MNILFQITFVAYVLATGTYVLWFAKQQKETRMVARWILTTAGILHTLALVARYLEVGHTPISNMHESVSFFAWSMTWGFLIFRWRYRVKNFGTFVSIGITLLMLVAALASKEVAPLPPALQSLWLPIHASIAIMANAFLGMGFCGGQRGAHLLHARSHLAVVECCHHVAGLHHGPDVHTHLEDMGHHLGGNVGDGP